jgi:hypothetical protein
MSATFRKYIPFSKVDEAKREVWGIVTAEVPDKDGEVCDYDTTKPYYKAWNDEFSKATDGKSIGNLRRMHQLDAIGKGVGIDFNDPNREISMGFKVTDDRSWNDVQEGVLTGFSHGGSYVKTWQEDGRRYYTAEISEVSLVDNPCLGVAHFAFIRADGEVEMRKIRSEAVTAVDATGEALKALQAELAAIKADLEKGKNSMDLEKAKSAMGHLNKAMEHHGKMGDHMQECMKCMGEGGTEKAAGTGTAAAAGTSLTMADVQKAITDSMNAAFQGFAKAITPAAAGGVQQTQLVTKSQDALGSGVKKQTVNDIQDDASDVKPLKTVGAMARAAATIEAGTPPANVLAIVGGRH